MQLAPTNHLPQEAKIHMVDHHLYHPPLLGAPLRQAACNALIAEDGGVGFISYFVLARCPAFFPLPSPDMRTAMQQMPEIGGVVGIVTRKPKVGSRTRVSRGDCAGSAPMLSISEPRR
jgi:hypothetical protein